MFLYKYLFPSKPVIQKPVKSSEELVNDAVSRLLESLNVLTSRESSLQKEILDNKNEARTRLKNNDKNNAQLYLMKSKMLENSLSETISNKFNISNQISTLQNSSFTNQLVSNMEQTRETFRTIAHSRDSAYVATLAKDISDEMNKTKSIQSIISSPLNVGDIADELSMMQADIEHEKEVQQDMELLKMPIPPDRSVYREDVNDSGIRNISNTRTQSPIVTESLSSSSSKRGGPRVIRVINGVIHDNKT